MTAVQSAVQKIWAFGVHVWCVWGNTTMGTGRFLCFFISPMLKLCFRTNLNWILWCDVAVP